MRFHGRLFPTQVDVELCVWLCWRLQNKRHRFLSGVLLRSLEHVRLNPRYLVGSRVQRERYAQYICMRLWFLSVRAGNKWSVLRGSLAHNTMRL